MSTKTLLLPLVALGVGGGMFMYYGGVLVSEDEAYETLERPASDEVPAPAPVPVVTPPATGPTEANLERVADTSSVSPFIQSAGPLDGVRGATTSRVETAPVAKSDVGSATSAPVSGEGATVPEKPAYELDFDGSFVLSAPLEVTVLVCNTSQQCVGATMHPVCSAPAVEAEKMLAEQCGDGCRSSTEKEAVRAWLCEKPRAVRTELPNSSYDGFSTHQLWFVFPREKPDDYYTVELVALTEGPAWVETYDGDHQLLSELSAELNVGGSIQFRIVRASDGVMELHRAQVDVDGDGKTDQMLSHRKR